MLIMNWIPTSLLILLKVQNLTGKCTSSSADKVECISVDEEELMSFINGRDLWELKIENSFIYQLEMLPTYRIRNLIIKNSSVKTFFPVKLNGLDFLDLSFNEISAVNGLNNTNLEELIMHHNRIEFLDGYWFESNIKKLDLSHNSIKNFTALSCTRLYSLNLSHNLIEELSNLLVNLRQVEMLDLSYNKLKNVKSEEIPNLSYFKMLNLSHNHIQSIEYARNMYPAISCIYRQPPSENDDPFDSVEMYNDDNDDDFDYGFLDLSSNRLNLSGEFVGNGNCNYYRLRTISFESNDLKDLNFLLSNKSRTIRGNSLTFRNNKITKIYPYNFQGFILRKLDLSLNGIESILPLSFRAAEVTELRLDQNKITSLNSSDLIGLSGLARLNISFNPLSTIDEFSFRNNFSSLWIIDLSHCSLEKIPVGLFRNLYLSAIYLSHNRIEVIEPHTFPSLEILDLSHNKIKNLPGNVFSGLTISVSLCLSYNPLKSFEGVFNNTTIGNAYLTGISLGKLSEKDVKGLEFMTYLDLSNTNITELSNNTFDKLSYLEELILDSNSIRTIPSNFFGINTKLTSLSIARNPISTIASDCFPHKMNLEYLYLTLFGKLEKKRFSNLMFLRELHIVHSTLPEIRKHSFKGLINLNTLNLENTTVLYVEPGAFIGLNGLVNFDVRSLFVNVTTLESGIFRGLKALKSLNFSSIGIDVIEYGSFYGLDSLVDLTLSHNKINHLPTGIFRNLVELKHLHLQHNRIRYLKTGEFSNLSNLRFLDLSHNQLDFPDRYIFFPLRKLEVLDINSNNVDHFAYKFTLKHLSSLKTIGIGKNEWSCDDLPIMLNEFEQHGINYTEISKLDFEVRNIEGINCR